MLGCEKRGLLFLCVSEVIPFLYLVIINVALVTALPTRHVLVNQSCHVTSRSQTINPFFFWLLHSGSSASISIVLHCHINVLLHDIHQPSLEVHLFSSCLEAVYSTPFVQHIHYHFSAHLTSLTLLCTDHLSLAWLSNFVFKLLNLSCPSDMLILILSILITLNKIFSIFNSVISIFFLFVCFLSGSLSPNYTS